MKKLVQTKLEIKVIFLIPLLIVSLILGMLTGMKLRRVRFNGVRFNITNPALEYITDFRNKDYASCDKLAPKDEKIMTSKSFYLQDNRFKQMILDTLSSSITDVKVVSIDKKTGVVNLLVTFKCFEKLPEELNTDGIEVKDAYNKYIMGKKTIGETDLAIQDLYYQLFEKNCLVNNNKTQSMNIELAVKTIENGKQVVVGATEFVNSIMSASGMLDNLSQYDDQAVGVLQYLVDTVED